MKQSSIPIHTRKEAPTDEQSKNARLLLRNGFLNKHASGVYEFLPLGLRSLNKIINIIREEMNMLGAQEVLLSALQNPEIWKKTSRWSGDTDEVWFKTSLNSPQVASEDTRKKEKKTGGSELGLGFTHEEPITSLMATHISSYQHLPCSLYQFQTKFRNEARAKSGIMRTREFIMKDLYSFAKNKEEHNVFYEKVASAYMRIFERIGFKDRVYRTYASGGLFSEFSDEFQVVCDAGEDVIYISDKKNIALNKEVYTDAVIKKLGIDVSDLREAKATEVGNIFTLGTRFSEALECFYTNEQGERVPVFMGSYGIGPARILGTLIELYASDSNMCFPESVSPYTVHIIELEGGKEVAQSLYELLINQKVDVLYDDRSVRAGEKFADADIIGIPHRMIVSTKSINEGGIEYTDRITEETQNLSPQDAVAKAREVIQYVK
ncbi:MAG: His/Gly/Thr/Pro-type tRNA ligase C-terminal domain-containing protein [Alphaproteobacteria bacterium]|nr:His/Gly/Thr/Pro-type tRNA ligase C-terminal domain-containing protein [Alphaproteobacteria bacterium]